MGKSSSLFRSKTLRFLAGSAVAVLLLGCAPLAIALEQPASASSSTAMARGDADSGVIQEADFSKALLENLNKRRAEAVAESVVAQIPAGTSDLDTYRYLHDYLALNCEYDENYQADTTSERYTAYGALVQRRAVCQGYALAYEMLCKKAGLPVEVVVNPSIHAWNMVRLEGAWYHVDCTWDDPTPDTPKNTKLLYFLLSDSKIREIGKGSHSYWVNIERNRDLPTASSALYDNAWWKSADRIAVADGAYYGRVIDQSSKEMTLVAWRGLGEPRTIASGNTYRDSYIWDCVEFGGQVYYFQGYNVYRIAAEDQSELVYTVQDESCRRMRVYNGQLVCSPKDSYAPLEVVPVPAGAEAACVHAYRAVLKPASTASDGCYEDTCAFCGDVQRYRIPRVVSATSRFNGKVAPTEITFPYLTVLDAGGNNITAECGAGNFIGSWSPGTYHYDIPLSLPYVGTVPLDYTLLSPQGEGDGGSGDGTSGDEGYEDEEPPAKPGRVTGVKLKVSKSLARKPTTTVTVTWKKVPSAQFGYTIRFNNGYKSGLQMCTYSAGKVKKSFIALKGKVVKVKVRAYGVAGKGPWSRTVKIRVK